MFEKITLDMLTQDGVSLKKQQYTTVDGKEYPIGEPWRRAYTTAHRASKPDGSARALFICIMAVWGDVQQ